MQFSVIKRGFMNKTVGNFVFYETSMSKVNIVSTTHKRYQCPTFFNEG